MVALIGSIIAFVTFGAILKLAGQKGEAPTPVAAVNYLLAAAVCSALALRQPLAFTVPGVVLLGAATGIGFVVGFFILFRAIERAGLSVAQPIVGMSVVIPTLASMLLWRERPTALQVAAMAAVCVALLLLGTADNRHATSDSSTEDGKSVTFLLLSLFVLQGLVTLSPKVLEELGYGQYRWTYLAVLFGSAGIGATIRWLWLGDRATRLAVGLGLGLGGTNIASTALQLTALAALPGIIVFPVMSVGPMALGTALGILVWKERPARRALAGALLALPAVLLLSL